MMSEHHKSINQKLESFMKRNLLSSDYQKIRCYERCIVDKSMKLALLTHKNLLITDFPPRTLHYTLPLVDFISLTLVQDLPDFLHGTEQLNTQHISLKFRQDGIARVKRSTSQTSFVSVSSEVPLGDTASSSDTSPSNSVSGTSLSSTLWHESITSRSPSRALKHSPVMLSVSDNTHLMSRSVDRMDLNDSGNVSLSSSTSSFSPCSSPTITDLDLFLLTESSFFFKLLKAATLNEKIRETKQLNFSVPEKRPSSARKRKNSSMHLHLYTQLSSEIRTNKALEGRFLLIKELTTAATTNSKIKPYFWKDTQLFGELLRDVRRYRVESSTANNRADELEYLILLETCIATMFRESEHLPQRIELITANSNSQLKCLLESISHKPRIATYLTSSTEVEGLCQELVDTTTSLLFEVVLAASEHPKFGSNFSLSNVVSLIENHAKEFIPVYNDIIERSLCLVSRKPSTLQTVQIYQAFYTMDALSKSSKVLGDFLCSKFSEDIKYYCATPEVKILRYSPLQNLAIENVRTVSEFVQTRLNHK